ncbi:MAG TPA: phosphoribosylanthranilate isomerase [Chryseosolibacter sp.]|nr:phosphoribosylanthranilate isomerase [Chryseosolibacter sp.]
MREPDNIREVAQLRPDYMGFIFYDKTPRYVGDDFIFPEGFPSTTKRVGVFVNSSSQAILSKVGEFKLDFVQLHGHETVGQCRELRQQGLKVIKAFSVDENMDFTVTKPYKDAVDYILFDTKGKFYGGNARTFDWSVLARYDQAVPFFLSGGITPENVGAIKELKGLNIRAIDVNSGVERRPAFKDVEKIKAIKAILKI